MTELSVFLLVFLGVAVFFLFFHLMLGKIVRPARPDAEKLTIYECGEPTIGSAWIQFDLRFYVVALLFVIFDVEVVFFFPWAVVFGKANAQADPGRNLAKYQLPQTPEQWEEYNKHREQFGRQLKELLPPHATNVARLDAANAATGQLSQEEFDSVREATKRTVEGAESLAWLAFLDILVFFGVLLVGFAYLWKRGDLDWVRSTAAEQSTITGSTPPLTASKANEFVSTGLGL